MSTADEDKVEICNAILTNTGIKIFFGGLDPDDAELVARLLFTGHVNLCEWKSGSERPVAVGQDKAAVENWSRSEMESESLMRATTHSHAYGSGRGTFSGTSTSTGSGASSGESYGQVLTPPVQFFGPNAPNASLIPYPLSQSVGESSAQSTFEQISESSGETHSEFEMYGEAETEAHGTNRGTARSRGSSEVFVTRYQWLPAELYSLTEQMHRLTGELMNLAPREVFVKIRGGRPFRTRTADVPAAFRSSEFKQLMLPRYRAAALARSPYIRAAAEVDAEIAARFAPPLPQPEKEEPESWREPFDYPDPPPPPDAPRLKPKLRIVRDDET